MSFPVWCELICDGCARTFAGLWATGEYIPRTTLKTQSEHEGAIFKNNGDVLCKACDERLSPATKEPT